MLYKCFVFARVNHTAGIGEILVQCKYRATLSQQSGTRGGPCPSVDDKINIRSSPANTTYGLYNPLPAKLFYLNFYPLEVVSRYRDPQLQVGENYPQFI